MNSSQIPESITFSILMANFNNSKFIEEAIESVLTQSYQYWELIIVDDCSTDKSIEKINPFLKDKRIKLFLHKKNRGYGGSLKTAADNSSKKILAILDPDDKLHETALEVMANAYKEYPEYGFIYSTYWGCDSELKNCVVNKEIGQIIPKKKIFFRERISHLKTFRKDVYKKTTGFDVNQRRAVDKDLIYKLEEISKIKFINIPLYYYRRHKGGISQSANKYQALIYDYIAKCKAYKRRLNTNIPNCNLWDLYSEYLQLTLQKQLKFFKKLLHLFRINKIYQWLSKSTPTLSLLLKQSLFFNKN